MRIARAPISSIYLLVVQYLAGRVDGCFKHGFKTPVGIFHNFESRLCLAGLSCRKIGPQIQDLLVLKFRAYEYTNHNGNRGMPPALRAPYALWDGRRGSIDLRNGIAAPPLVHRTELSPSVPSRRCQFAAWPWRCAPSPERRAPRSRPQESIHREPAAASPRACSTHALPPCP